MKRQKGYRAAVFTFDTAPMAKLSGTDQKVITTNQERRNNMAKMGIDYLVEYPFTRDVVHLSAEAFVREILIGKMNARAMVVGTDCGFGYQRSGNAQVLKELSSRYGYELEVIVKEQDEKRDISSTYIKEELSRGNIEKANKLLGEPYAIHGEVVHGNHIGAPVLGFPTANLRPSCPDKLVPASGVYAVRAEAGGRFFGGMLNIGSRPTLRNGSDRTIETHLFDFSGNLYGEPLTLYFEHRLRDERPFATLEELSRQLARDAEQARKLLSLC